MPLISEYPQLIGDAFWIKLEFEMLVSGYSRKAEYPEKNISEQPEKIKRKRTMSYGVTFSSKLERNHTTDACKLPTPSAISLLISFSFSLNCVKKLVNSCSFFCFCFLYYVLFTVFERVFVCFFFFAKARKRLAVRALNL